MVAWWLLQAPLSVRAAPAAHLEPVCTTPYSMCTLVLDRGNGPHAAPPYLHTPLYNPCSESMEAASDTINVTAIPVLRNDILKVWRGRGLGGAGGYELDCAADRQLH